MKGPVVKNAANESQVQGAAKRMEEIREQELNDIRTVLGSASGRRLLWRIMERCKTFASVWDNSARIHYNSGQQDLGHFIMSEIIQANDEMFIKMMRESKEEKK